jgi:hypothetical protein
MTFDIILGNPPYNDSQESLQKRNGATTQGGSFYKHFIKLGLQHLAPDGTLAFILPGGAYNSFIKAGGYINHVFHIHGKYWPKVLSTKIWFVNKYPNNTITTNPPVFKKLLTLNNYRKPQRGGGKITSYSFTASAFTSTQDKIFKTSYVKTLSKKEQQHNNTQWELEDTDINLKNITFLLKWFSKWFHYYGYQWYMWNKIFKYQWLEGKTELITEQDIIDYYGLTESEVKEIKHI